MQHDIRRIAFRVPFQSHDLNTDDSVDRERIERIPNLCRPPPAYDEGTYQPVRVAAREETSEKTQSRPLQSIRFRECRRSLHFEERTAVMVPSALITYW